MSLREIHLQYYMWEAAIISNLIHASTPERATGTMLSCQASVTYSNLNTPYHYSRIA